MLADHHVERPSSFVLISSIRQICSVDSQRIYIPTRDAMPSLTFWLPHGICNTDLQQLPTGSIDPVRTLGALDPARNRARRGELLTVCVILHAEWPALLVTLSFLLSTNISDALFGDVLASL